MGTLNLLIAAIWGAAVCGLAALPTELVGRLTRQDLLENLPEWKAQHQVYAPDLGIVARLQDVHEEVRVEVFLGSWCPDCRQHVGAYLKLMDMVGNPLITTSYTGVPRSRKAREEYIAGRGVERLPTFIVYFRGREIGRLVETPRVSVEADLWAILAPAAGFR